MPDELGLEDGRHPTGGKGLEMAQEFEPTQLTFFLHPELSTQLWTEGISEEHEEHATIQITYGRVFLFGRESGYMEITLPAQLIVVCRRSTWSKHVTTSPRLALLARTGSNAAGPIRSACGHACGSRTCRRQCQQPT